MRRRILKIHHDADTTIQNPEDLKRLYVLRSLVPPSISRCQGVPQGRTVPRRGRIGRAWLGALLAPLFVVAASPAEKTAAKLGRGEAVVHSEGQSVVRVTHELGVWRIRQSRNSEVEWLRFSGRVGAR